MSRPTSLLRHRTLAAACLLALTACEKQPTQPTRDPDLLMVVDGIEVRISELEPFVAFYDFLPENSRNSKIRRILTDYLLPLRLSQRTFAKEREQLRATAQALTEVATNLAELENHVGDGRLKRRHGEYQRLQLEPPVAIFLFDQLMTGAVSPPIEVPQGYVVVACRGIKQAPLVLEDMCDSVQVAFTTHDTMAAWRIWNDDEMARIAKLVTYLHPDYRDALPPGFEVPL